MQLKNLALTLAGAFTAANAYAITENGVNCRSGPSTSNEVVTTYDQGADVTISCQSYGEDIQGTSIWDKTSDGCYVTDYYVETGSDSMITDNCESSDDGSSYQGEISREEIMSRGEFWVSQQVPYSMTAEYPDPQGRNYRTDCSGFVSMALHAAAPGANTVSLPAIAQEISWDDLQPGDFVGTLGEGTGGADGHVTLFKSWVDDSKAEYNTLECRGTYGCVAYKRPVDWMVGSFTAKPYRYIHVVD